MLDVIADFWKPVKKAPQVEPLRPEMLQIGSTLGFGFVPQVILSGRRLQVSGVNTYQFGDEALTSFVLTQEKDPSCSMIVAESEGEYYLAISRRISMNDRVRLFDETELEAAMAKADATRLSTREQMADYKGWIVSSYKREIQGLKGVIFKGDYRKESLPPAGEGQEFEYTLLVSDSNEHAIEIEKYTDGRVEVYATVYRRMSDIGEITHPAGSEAATPASARPEVRLASGAGFTSPAPAPKLTELPVPANESTAPVLVQPAPLAEAAPAEQPAVLPTALATPEVKSEPIALPELQPAAPEAKPDSSQQPAAFVPAAAPVHSPVQTQTNANPNPTRTETMSTAEALKPKLYVQSSNPESDLKAGAINSDGIECELRVANKLIDEAIRNEMRLTDIVRRIVELPVAYPESVQIPMNLTDEDFALLAIRYGIPANDRNAIKRRIVEDLNDFSGKKKA